MHTHTLKIRLLACLAALAALLQAHAAPQAPGWTHPGPLKPDSSNFVTASILVMTEGPEFYSTLGHSTLRLECPVHNLDYCFTFETEHTGDYLLRFFSGRAQGHVVAVPTAEFIDTYRREGRGVTQHELNLTLHQKQRLWENLDNDYVDPDNRKYNFLMNNCTSVTTQAIDNSLIDETINYQWPAYITDKSGDPLRFYTRNSPWMEFLCFTLLGYTADMSISKFQCLAPESVVPTLAASAIENADGETRPVLVGKPIELVPQTYHYQAPPLSPAVVFGALLIVVLAITLLQWRLHWHRLGAVTDAVLVAAHTLAGMALLLFSTLGSLFASSWNWYLIPLCPIAWALCLWARRHNARRLWMAVSIVLALFVAATPLSAQLDWTHQLVTATLLCRTLYHALRKQ